LELIKRSFTGFLFVAILAFCIVKGPIWFASLFALCTILTSWEFVSLMNKNKNTQISRLWVVVASISLFGAIFMSCIEYISFVYFMPFILSLIIIFVKELYKNKTSPITNLALGIMPILYIALPFSLLSVLAFIPNKENGMTEYCYVIPLTLFLFIWANDVGAYCIGCSIGKHKLFERISPKKTWEGLIGGASFTIIAAILLYRFLPTWYGNMSVWIWIGMALIIVLFGTWGDLVESMIKRELQIKDSGKTLPGHGGFLDRFDSTLLAIPATVIYFCTILL
jgi:phosphatidate cytidylyltransferase